MKRVSQPVQVRIIPRAPSSVESGSSNSSQKQLNIDLRLNVDIDSGKVQLSIPNQGPSQQPIGSNAKTFKPATSSTQPALHLEEQQYAGPSVSRTPNRFQQHLPVSNICGISTQKPPEETYCVLCKRGYLPHQFGYHIQLHKDTSANHLNERSFLKKQEPHFAIVPHQVPMSSYAASSKEPSLGGHSQQSGKVLSHRSHSQHQFHISSYSRQSQQHPPNVLVYPNAARSVANSQQSLGVQSSSSFRVVDHTPQLHIMGSFANSGVHSDRQRSFIQHTNNLSVVQLERQQPSTHNLVTSQVAEVHLTNSGVVALPKPELSNRDRSVHSVPDPSLVDRLSQSREQMMWQSMMVEGTDYNYERLKRPWQQQTDSVVQPSLASSSHKQKAPKNLLAMEMAIEQKQLLSSKQASKEGGPEPNTNRIA